MKIMLMIPIIMLTTLPSCTVNVTIADTHGYANDLVDETATTDAEPELEIPLSHI